MAAIFEAATSAGETASLLMISAVFIIFVAAAVKTRTIRSFQFEMLLFALVLFAAEFPRILGTLGLIDVSSFEGFGLEVHSGSMVVLAAFVAYRVYGFRRPSQALLGRAEGDARIAEAIRLILEEKIGESAARAVDFYFDTRIATFDPKGYTRMLERTFHGGAEPLVGLLVVELCSRFQVAYSEGMSLPEAVVQIRRSGRMVPTASQSPG